MRTLIHLLIIASLLLLTINAVIAQVGIGNPTPHENAALDLKGSNKGLLLPEVSLPGSFTGVGPATGLIVWNTNSGFSDGVGVYYNNGTPASPSWVKISTGGVGVINVSANAPLSSTGGATPVISLSQANTSTNGFLSATDWNIFNTKLTTVSVSTRLTGNGTSGNPIDLNNSGVTAGTYTKITVDQYGRATSGTSLSATDIPNLDASKITSGTFPVTRLATGTSGQILRTNGTTVEWWTPNYLTSFTETDPTWNGTANQTGDIGRSGKVMIGGTTTPLQTLDVNGRINVVNGVIQRGGSAITTTDDLGLYSRVSGNWVRIMSNSANIRFYTNDNPTESTNSNFPLSVIHDASRPHVLGRFRHITYHPFNNSSWSGNPANAVQYFPAPGGDGSDDVRIGGSSGLSNDYRREWVAPYSGRIIRVIVRVGSNSGSNPEFNGRIARSINGAHALMTSTANGADNDAFVVFECTQNNTFNRGDRIGVGIDMNCSGCYMEDTNYFVTIVWEYDMFD